MSIENEKDIIDNQASCHVLPAIDDDGIDVVELEAHYTPAEYAKLLRKIDFTLLPYMWLAYGRPIIT
jgi:hypothetical protein